VAYKSTITVYYGDRSTKLARLRVVDQQFDEFIASVMNGRGLWNEGPRNFHEQLDACIGVLGALATFALHVGIPRYAKERLNDLLVALGELNSGRNSTLLRPAPVHPGTFSPSDLGQQATAQVCVDLLRTSGASATEARTKISKLFDKHQLPKFSTAKLRALHSRLKGPGCSLDAAYDMYVSAKAFADESLAERGLGSGLSIAQAEEVADLLIGFAKRRDHRRNFYFAPREDSSEAP